VQNSCLLTERNAYKHLLSPDRKEIPVSSLLTVKECSISKKRDVINMYTELKKELESLEKRIEDLRVSL